MSPQNKTPRQVPGRALVPFTTMVEPKMLETIRLVARHKKCSIGAIVRQALTDYFVAWDL